MNPGIAVIGYGGMGGHHVRRLMLIPEEVRVTGIFDIDPAKGKAAQQAGINVFSSQEELLADPATDIVIIATPNDTHKSIAVASMERKKHVICEKPVTMFCADLREMIDCANKNGVIFSVHQNRRWDEDFLMVSNLYREDALGRVFTIESRVHGSRGIPGDWRKQASKGGGMVLDWGVHILDQMLCLMGDRAIESLYAQYSYALGEEVEDGFRADFRFEGSLSFHLEVSTMNYINLPRWYIQGAKGTAVIERFDSDARLMLPRGKADDATPVVTAAGITKTMAPRGADTLTEVIRPKLTSDVKDYYRNFIKAVRGMEEQIVTHAQMLRVLGIIEKMHISAGENTIIRNI
ncbi:MAG: Gfo/Idh/MocA family oxidoreductase [Clostridiales bacterium]|jgi:predicted dehydrogenase|nr:Gfo/Idh/MocA family oxidoreductase [Clostridiales bacterium]